MSTIGDDDIEVDENAELDDEEFDENAHSGCYVFQSPWKTEEPSAERPPKRRKTDKSKDADALEPETLPLLLGGHETERCAQLRRDAYQREWSRQEKKIHDSTRLTDEKTTKDLLEFINNAPALWNSQKIPTGLIITGPDRGAQDRLFQQWSEESSAKQLTEMISLDWNQAPNLTTALKNLIRIVIAQRVGLDRYHEFLQKHKRLIPMNYDLELLELFVEQEGLNKIVVSIRDIDSFETLIFSELVASLSSFSDRVPIVLLVGVATTIELFEARLPSATVKLLHGTVFNLTSEEDLIYKTYQLFQNDDLAKMWIGPTLSRVLCEQAKEQELTLESVALFFRYAYMSHFFANPLSVLLNDTPLDSAEEIVEICLAIRNTLSFRRHVEWLLDSKETNVMKRLLDDDNHLLAEARRAIEEGKQQLLELREAIANFIILHSFLPPSENASPSLLEIDVLASEPGILDSEWCDRIISRLQTISSTQLKALVAQLHFTDTEMRDFVDTLLTNLKDIHKKSRGAPVQATKASTTNAASTRHPTIIPKQTPKASKFEETYAALISSLMSQLSSYFASHLIDLKSLFMHEAFVYDLKLPLSTAFTPRPRYAIERALDRPADYLGCECCATTQRSNTLPPASLLWQLWCEAGSVVNVKDLWETFKARIMEPGEDEDEGMDQQEAEKDGLVDERMAMALFYRSLAELRMLGFVKPTKKKVDCLAKVMWRGL